MIMSSKSRKSLSLWVTCDKCTCTISQKDVTIHESQCPPSDTQWNCNYIRNSILYSTVDIYTTQEFPKNITENNTHDMIFMSQSALELCQISIGDRVLIAWNNGAIIKTAWPINDKYLTNIYLTKNTIETDKINGKIKVKKMNTILPFAKEIEIHKCGNKLFNFKLTSDVLVLIKNNNERKAFTVNNRINFSYYGKRLVFKITKIIGDHDNYENIEDIFDKLSIQEKEKTFYEALYCTKWILKEDEEIEKNQENNDNESLKLTLGDIGGYQQIIEELMDVMNITLKKTGKPLKGFKASKGILLYGTAGVGKSTIITAILSEYDVRIFSLNGINNNINKGNSNNYETQLAEIFTDAKLQAPSVILIEDIDNFCPRKFGAGSENEKRILGTLIKEIDDLQKNDADTILLATSSKPDFIDPSLRRPGRIDREFEVSAPTPQMRREILSKFLNKISHTITPEELDRIAFTTHGFVGADLYGLCSQAAMCTIKRHQNDDNSNDEIKITVDDFDKALTMVKPSAMKEVLVEIPNVKWSEIGGQQGLKLKLQQAVEWPLKHSQVFVRLGITPPKGVLMFGPPGCSKTMIARALATESKLNFINIKGPELFSKWVGESERAVREVFRKARQVAPSIVFIDEIDAIGGERASGNSANTGNNVQERVLAQLLTELDGVTSLGNVTLVAATNRPDRIDKALLRPGRLDRIVYVPLPDYETRLEIFQIKFRKMPISEDVNIIDLVELTEGYSGAEVQAICHEAAMKALEDNFDATTITKKHFKAALSIVSPRTPPSLIKLYEDYVNNMR